MTRAFIGIGSNIDPEKNVLAAIRSIGRQLHLVGISTVYCSDALDRPEQPPYFNCVVEIETDAPPVQMKHAILRPIENALGRKRTGDKYASRTIDLDLIAYGDLTINEEDFKLPDPDILERPFLAIPLFELAPDLVLPGYGLRIRDIVAGMIPEGMEPLRDYSRLLKEDCSPVMHDQELKLQEQPHEKAHRIYVCVA